MLQNLLAQCYERLPGNYIVAKVRCVLSFFTPFYPVAKVCWMVAAFRQSQKSLDMFQISPTIQVYGILSDLACFIKCRQVQDHPKHGADSAQSELKEAWSPSVRSHLPRDPLKCELVQLHRLHHPKESSAQVNSISKVTSVTSSLNNV